jgi:hypothetical protein
LLAATIFAMSRWLGLQVGAAEGKEGGRALGISEPTTSQVTSNLHQLSAKKDGLKQLEDDLFKPLKKTFSPQDSLDGVLVRPTRPSGGTVIPSKKVKELLEKQRDWVFMSPEELTAGPTVEEIFNIPDFGPDGLQKKKLSPMERYYFNQLDPSSVTNYTKLRERDRKGRYSSTTTKDEEDETDSNDDSKPPARSGDREGNVKRFFEPDPEKTDPNAPPDHGTLSDIFGLGLTKPSPELTKAQNSRMDEFKQMLGLPSTPASVEAFRALSGLAEPAPKLANPFGSGGGSLSPPLPTALGSPFGAINPAPGAGTLPDMNWKGLDQPNFSQPSLAPAMPKVDLPSLTPPAPNFNLPKRAF